MTREEHIERHKLLDKALNELTCDMLIHTNMAPDRNTILELMKWSLKQTTNPHEKHTPRFSIKDIENLRSCPKCQKDMLRTKTSGWICYHCN